MPRSSHPFSHFLKKEDDGEERPRRVKQSRFFEHDRNAPTAKFEKLHEIPRTANGSIPAPNAEEGKAEAAPRRIQLSFENHGDISPDIEKHAQSVFKKISAILEKEWHVTSPMPVSVLLMTEEQFKGLAQGPNDPALWKYCFLMCNPPTNQVYLNVDLFTKLPEDAEAMVKHEKPER